ncbi:MAG TPA: hypothetical protein VFY62_04755 [Pseudomonas sp.]|nr:hypothetical protein [Pseudomonas sp.]
MSRECKACGAQVSNEATSCPGCGAALPAKRKLLPLAAFMLIVILIIQSYIEKSGDESVEVAPVEPGRAAQQ